MQNKLYLNNYKISIKKGEKCSPLKSKIKSSNQVALPKHKTYLTKSAIFVFSEKNLNK